MTTAFDILSHDETLQRHWIKRFLGALVDAALIMTPVYVVLAIISWHGLSWVIGAVISGFAWFIYSALFEYLAGATIGKMLLGLRVVATEGKLELHQTMLRNLTKTFAGFLLADLLLGMLIETPDPRQRFTDKMAKTSVIIERNVLF